MLNGAHGKCFENLSSTATETLEWQQLMVHSTETKLQSKVRTCFLSIQAAASCSLMCTTVRITVTWF